MSNYLAIGGVSRSLRNLLASRMEHPALASGATVHFTISTPSEDDDTDAPRINLFLYRITENEHYKNQEIPGHGHPGAYGRPPLSVDLHYLISAFGTASETENDFKDETIAQYLLGSAMRVLHDYPIITEDLEDDTGISILDPSLHGQFERVKLLLEPLTLDDLTNVWTALTVPYRLSAAYAVSVVQVESQGTRRYPKPVGELPDAGPRVHVITLTAPKIDQVRVRRQEMSLDDRPSLLPYARIGDRLVLLGSGFVRTATNVQLASITVTPEANPPVAQDLLEVTIPDDPELQPGPVPVKVVRVVEMGEPPEDRPGYKSNVAVFMLVPQVDTVTVDTVAGTVTVNGSRLYQANKDGQTVVGATVYQVEHYVAATPTSITVPLPSTDPGTYEVRVRVNGAESFDQATYTIPTP